jgi:hypothetical protein
VKEGEYSRYTLYTCMKIEQSNLLVLSSIEEGMRNDGGGEPNKDTL